LLHQVVGVKCISIDPYQLGFNNDEAIESGAFWFYRKLGFRPVRPELARLMAEEEKKLAADAGHRTSKQLLRRLSEGSVVYEAPDSQRGDWDRFAIRNIGLAVQRRMATEFDGDAGKIRAASTRDVARSLDLSIERLNKRERRGFDDLALVLALIEDLDEWAKSEKKEVVRIIRAKMGIDESVYARLLQGHPRMRASIIMLGETRPGER